MAKHRLERNSFKQRLKKGEVLIGLWSSLGSNMVAEILSLSDFDWVVFDTEHAPSDLFQLVGQLQAMNGSPLQSLVRPAWNDPVLMKRLLDIGFRNFVVPFVQSADEARAAVAATRYPPQGIRGVALATRAAKFGNIGDYVKKANAGICVIVQVENRTGLEALEDICRVRGVDAVFVGPSDLAASLGHLGDPRHRTVQKAIRGVAETCRRMGTVSGILAAGEGDARRYLKWGFTFVGVGSDTGLMRGGVNALAARFKS